MNKYFCFWKNKEEVMRVSKTDTIFANEKIISTVYGEISDIDCAKTPIERMINLVRSVSNPGVCQIEGYQVELEWSDTTKTIQDCVQEVLSIA